MAPQALAGSIIPPTGSIDWVDWTSFTTGSSGTGTGTLGSVDVNYTGDVTFGQTGTGTNYWTEGNPKPYTGNSVITNAPTPAEMIGLSQSGITNTLTFSEAVWSPVMAIVSQGQYGVPVIYDFDQSFTFLSEGRGYWGDGTYKLLAGDILSGRELHSAIQFNGWVSSISWVNSPNEYWHGITVGAPNEIPPQVPEPGTMLMLGSLATGFLGFAGFRKKKN